jgi:hypothetical protein
MHGTGKFGIFVPVALLRRTAARTALTRCVNVVPVTTTAAMLRTDSLEPIVYSQLEGDKGKFLQQEFVSASVQNILGLL